MILTCRVDWSVIREEVRQDPVLGKIYLELQQLGGTVHGFTLNHECLLYKGRVALPRSSGLIDKLLLEYHSTAFGGHNGEYKTYLRLAEDWFWEGMHKFVTLFVQQCLVCQQQKASH